MFDPLHGRTTLGKILQRMIRLTIKWEKWGFSLPFTATTRNGDTLGIAKVVDISRYPDYQLLFMERLYQSALRYIPEKYCGHVIVFEATVKPLYKLPQVTRAWRFISQNPCVVKLRETHVSIMKSNGAAAMSRAIIAAIHARTLEIDFPIRLTQTPTTGRLADADFEDSSPHI